jgi:hypothetical protein
MVLMKNAATTFQTERTYQQQAVLCFLIEGVSVHLLLSWFAL